MSCISDFYRFLLRSLKVVAGITNPWLILILFILFSSCYSSGKLNYLRSKDAVTRYRVNATEYLVQPNDVLDIRIQTRDPQQATFFNRSSLESRSFQANPASLFITGYPVSEEGFIGLAVIGELKVSDLTVEQIRDLIQTEIDKYLVNALVSIKLVSFKVSVLGDVKNPGIHYIYNTQVTIFEALGAAGDLNISAKRKNVKLLRQDGDETLIINLDLRDPDIIRSPYYFLHPNDVLYAQTSGPNIFRNNTGVFTLLLSAISTGLLIWNLSEQNNNNN